MDRSDGDKRGVHAFAFGPDPAVLVSTEVPTRHPRRQSAVPCGAWSLESTSVGFGVSDAGRADENRSGA